MSKRKKAKVIVDGANIAYAEQKDNGAPKLSNIINTYKKLKSMGYIPYVIVDASLRYKFSEDERQKFENFLNKKSVKQSPAETDADYFILKFAQSQDAYILTNDQLDDYEQEFPALKKRRKTYMIMDGDIEFSKID